MDTAPAMTSFPWLSTLVLAPALGAGLLALIPRRQAGVARAVALLWTSLLFVFSLGLLWVFEPSKGTFQLVETAEWIPSLGASYSLGLDGISLFLVLLTTLLVPIVLLSAQEAITDKVKAFLITFLVLETGMLGALLATDLLLFYVFWEVMLVPMYLLIGIWGSRKRVYATTKFVLYTLVGSLLMLVAILYLYQQTPGDHSFALADVLKAGRALPLATQLWLFGAFALSFGIKVPFFPLHTWLPDAHTEAPTGGSVILAGVLLKMGTYGFVRFAMPLFPDALAALTPMLVSLAVVGILYGALVAMVQKDAKRLVAYSSISHLGFVMLGLFALTPEAVVGGVYQMLNHGISTGGLFLAVGMLYERRHTRLIADFGGLAAVMPHFAVIFLIVCLSSLGLPGMNGFVGEFLVLVGTFNADIPGARWAAAVAASGVIFAAVYLLWMYLRVMFGPVKDPANRELSDLSGREWLVFAPIVALIFVMGLFPGYFLERIEPSVEHFITQVDSSAKASSRRALRPGSKKATAGSKTAKRNKDRRTPTFLPGLGDRPPMPTSKGVLERIRARQAASGQRGAQGQQGGNKGAAKPRIIDAKQVFRNLGKINLGKAIKAPKKGEE